MGWGLLLNRYTLAIALIVGGYFGIRWGVSVIGKGGYERAMAEVKARDAQAAIKALMREMRRDDRVHRIVQETMDSSRELAQINVTTTLSLERIHALLPASDPDGCRIPGGVWDELDAARDRAEAAAGERL